MTSSNLGLGSSDIHLDSANFQDRPDLLPLVEVIAKETEAERARLRAKEPPLTRGGGLISTPFGRYYHLCDRTPWYELLTDLHVIERCAVALGIKNTALLKRILDELRAPNWEVFFWIRQWLQSVPVADHIAMVSSIAATIKAN